MVTGAGSLDMMKRKADKPQAAGTVLISRFSFSQSLANADWGSSCSAGQRIRGTQSSTATATGRNIGYGE